MVKSQTPIKPHYLTISKTGKITCNDCPGWKASKICAHDVAEKSQTTGKYLKWSEKNQSSINITAFVTCASDIGTSKKGKQKSTAGKNRTIFKAPTQPCTLNTANNNISSSDEFAAVITTSLPAQTRPPVLPSTMDGSMLPEGDQFLDPTHS